MMQTATFNLEGVKFCAWDGCEELASGRKPTCAAHYPDYRRRQARESMARRRERRKLEKAAAYRFEGGAFEIEARVRSEVKQTFGIPGDEVDGPRLERVNEYVILKCATIQLWDKIQSDLRGGEVNPGAYRALAQLLEKTSAAADELGRLCPGAIGPDGRPFSEEERRDYSPIYPPGHPLSVVK